MPGRYRFLEHTADVLFEAYGKNFREALENAAEAMFSVMCEIGKLKEEKSFVIEEEADSLENLTVFTLSAILSESEIEEVLPKRFKVEKFAQRNGIFRIGGRVYGSRWENGKVKTCIKAVTHHLTKVERNGKFTVRVLLDI
ncbi:MAG: archease [Candidatus Micrarchaeota archaeon]|nr:archease [Candidatus Micrarchaeota archaeon]